MIRSLKWRALASGALALPMIAAWTRSVQAVTPDSPEVKAVIEKGLKYLETANDGRVGAKALVGLCFLKHGEDENHPQIKAAVDACKAVTVNYSGQGPIGSIDVYSNGLAIVFLCEVNPSKYQKEINALLTSLLAKQKTFGGWGYPDGQFVATGDTSMTQYGCLASWEAKKNGFVVPIESTENVCLWLMRTQDPSGGWGYQGKDPGPPTTSDFLLVKQTSVREGLSAAGLGSVYICADLLGLAVPNEENDAESGGLPPALQPSVDDAKKNLKPLTNRIEPRQIAKTEARGNGWWRFKYKIEARDFPYYYLYALERYKSFMEAATGFHPREPGWYNDGYALLRRKQQADGSWESKNNIIVPDTAFAILFLMRSTRKSIEKTKGFDAGILAGGQGLPFRLTDARLHDGKIVGKRVIGTPDGLLEILTQPDNADFSDLAADPQDLIRQLSEEDETARTSHLARLRRLVTAGPARSRLAAVQVLAKLRDVANVPTLIAALSDSEWSVVYEADQALRFISRAVGKDSLTELPDEGARADAIQSWRAWYASIRPELGSDKPAKRP